MAIRILKFDSKFESAFLSLKRKITAIFFLKKTNVDETLVNTQEVVGKAHERHRQKRNPHKAHQQEGRGGLEQCFHIHSGASPLLIIG